MPEVPRQPSERQEDKHDLVRLMSRIRAEEVFANPEAIRSFIDDLQYPQFEGYLNRINGICREIGTNIRQMEGGAYIDENIAGYSIGAYTPPAPGHIKPLMTKAFEALKTNRNTEQGATMLGLAINAIHPYNDGNGRTSRFAYSLLTRGYDGSSDDQSFYTDLLVNTEGQSIVDLNPRNVGLDTIFIDLTCEKVALMYGYDGPLPSYRYGGYDVILHGHKQAALLLFDRTVSHQSREILLCMTEDYGLDVPLLTEFILEAGLGMPEYIHHYGENERYQFRLEKIIPLLREDDIRNMLEGFVELKKMYIEWIIDTFTDPGGEVDAQEITRLYRPKKE